MTEKWIDVSAHNGVIVWPKVAASNVIGAVIRAGYGDDIRQQDKYFAENVAGAAAAGLKEAVYWFSYADSVSDAQKEWAVCRQIIEPYRRNIKFVAFDYEYDSYDYYKKIHGCAPAKALINEIVNAFLNSAKNDGFGTALYTNNDYRKSIFTAKTLAAWPIWLADYSGGPDIECFMQQTGSAGHVPGITGNVDTDILIRNVMVYTCDTSGTVEIPMGSCYTAKTTGNVQLVAGTSETSAKVQIVRCIWPEYVLWHIVPLGSHGQSVGIYASGGPRLFIVKVK